MNRDRVRTKRLLLRPRGERGYFYITIPLYSYLFVDGKRESFAPDKNEVYCKIYVPNIARLKKSFCRALVASFFIAMKKQAFQYLWVILSL
jgi:hypothetical protein